VNREGLPEAMLQKNDKSIFQPKGARKRICRMIAAASVKHSWNEWAEKQNAVTLSEFLNLSTIFRRFHYF
jgi:hypothetical protein